ncbi:iron-containing alcohol dehydrogenase [Bacillus massilinigeriensis]|uniref:iron-containing alcohol dehydrogenase n=1 Tax=Bacillus massilionigeriensis TaxID=1805475 RepID=UPI00096B0ECF|nr:iron-containing alcohol dehydrogenase [Bacillus massilionigeriensis]
MKITSYSEITQRTSLRIGAGTRILVSDLIEGLGGKRPVIFTDKGLTKAGLTQQIIDLFDNVPGIQLAGVFDEIEQDAKSSNINNGIQYYKACNADSMIALGGGSVLDTVKGIKWALHKRVNNIELALKGNVIEVWPAATEIDIPHVAIPTTAGTGAEVSPIAVIFNETIGVKCNLLHPYINADIAILDPDLTVGLPSYVTAFTGMDALSHAVEGYFTSKANPMTDALALQAIKLVVQNLKKAVAKGDDVQARSNMLQASTMGIHSFTLTFGENPVHNIAHTLGAKFRIPHGLAISTLLPTVMKHLAPLYLGKIREFALALGVGSPSNQPEECLTQCIEVISELRNDIGLPADFSEYNIDSALIPQLIPAVQLDPSGIGLRIPEDVLANILQEVIGTKVPVE